MSQPLVDATPTEQETGTGKPRGSLEPILKDDVKYYEHQVDGVRRMARMPSFLLADDMGLGKSLQSLTVAAIDIKMDRNLNILVVCPVSLRGNWEEEIKKFTRLPVVSFGEITNAKGVIKTLSPAKRIAQLRVFETLPGAKILICNYEQVTSHKNDFNKFRFDVGIFDEAHYLKNPKSKRTKACHALRLKRTMLLTGTPMLNQVNELWSLLHMIDNRKWPDGSYYRFVNRYCVMGGFKNKQIVGVKNEKELTEYLQAVMIRRLKSEVLDLPEVQIIQRKVDLLPVQRELYDEAETNLQVDMVGLDKPYEIENALTKFTRLKQICGTTLDFNGEDHSAKLDLVVNDAMEVLKNGHKLVVFTQFRPVQEALVRRLVEHGKRTPSEDFDVWELHGDIKKQDRQPTVHEWGLDPKPGVIVCMLQVAGVGLNMTYARNGFFVDKLFVPGLNQQAVDRMHRIGASKTQPVQISEYICRKTIENRVEQINVSKKKLFTQIVNESDYKRELMRRLMAAEEEDDVEE